MINADIHGVLPFVRGYQPVSKVRLCFANTSTPVQNHRKFTVSVPESSLDSRLIWSRRIVSAESNGCKEHYFESDQDGTCSVGPSRGSEQSVDTSSTVET